MERSDIPIDLYEVERTSGEQRGKGQDPLPEIPMHMDEFIAARYVSGL